MVTRLRETIRNRACGLRDAGAPLKGLG